MHYTHTHTHTHTYIHVFSFYLFANIYFWLCRFPVTEHRLSLVALSGDFSVVVLLGLLIVVTFVTEHGI